MIMTCREYLKNHENENLSWCKPYADKSGDYLLILQDKKLIAIKTPEGVLTKPDFLTRLKLAQKINPDFDEYVGCSSTTIMLDAMHETGCAHCPYFENGCEAMDEYTYVP